MDYCRHARQGGMMSQAGYPPGKYDYAGDILKSNKRISDLERELTAANEKLARLRELAKVLVMAAYSKDEDACTIALRALRAELEKE